MVFGMVNPRGPATIRYLLPQGVVAVAKLKPRLAPTYSIAQAAHFLKVPVSTVRSWVLGRDHARQYGKRCCKPVVATPKDADLWLSFRDLIELVVLQGLPHRIQRDRGLAVRFFPPLASRPEARSVMLDPRVSFGRPVLARLGVSTSVIVDRINAGEKAADLVKDYGATGAEIMDALAYESACDPHPS
jgi:uncharacterized protein (DUF433 family)